MISSCVYSTRYARQGSIAIYTFVDIILSFNISVDLFGCTVNIVGDTNVGSDSNGPKSVPNRLDRLPDVSTKY